MKNTHKLISQALFTPAFTGGNFENRRIFSGADDMEDRAREARMYEQAQEQAEAREAKRATATGVVHQEVTVQRAALVPTVQSAVAGSLPQEVQNHIKAGKPLQGQALNYFLKAHPNSAAAINAYVNGNASTPTQATTAQRLHQQAQKVSFNSPAAANAAKTQHQAEIAREKARYQAALNQRNQLQGNVGTVDANLKNYIDQSLQIGTKFQLSGDIYQELAADTTRGFFTPGPLFKGLKSIFEKKGMQIPRALQNEQAFARIYPNAQRSFQANVGKIQRAYKLLDAQGRGHSTDPLFNAFNMYKGINGLLPALKSSQGAKQMATQLAKQKFFDIAGIATVANVVAQLGAAVTSPKDIIISMFGPQMRELKSAAPLSQTYGFIDWVAGGMIGEYNPAHHATPTQDIKQHNKTLVNTLTADAQAGGNGNGNYSENVQAGVTEGSLNVINGYKSQFEHDMARVQDISGGPFARFFKRIGNSPEAQALRQVEFLKAQIEGVYRNGVEGKDELSQLANLTKQFEEAAGNLVNLEKPIKINQVHFKGIQDEAGYRIEDVLKELQSSNPEYFNKDEYLIDPPIGTSGMLHIYKIEKAAIRDAQGEYIANKEGVVRAQENGRYVDTGSIDAFQGAERADTIVSNYWEHVRLVHSCIQESVNTGVLTQKYVPGQSFSVAGKIVTVDIKQCTPAQGCDPNKVAAAMYNVQTAMAQVRTLSDACKKEQNPAKKAQMERYLAQINELVNRMIADFKNQKWNSAAYSNTARQCTQITQTLNLQGWQAHIPANCLYGPGTLNPNINIPDGVARPVDMAPIFDVTVGDVQEVFESDEPTLQSDEPTLESDEPTLQSDEPTLESDEPTLQSDEPTLESDEPTLQSDEPTLESDEPTLQSDEPTLESDEPTLQSDEPTLESDEPTLESDEPTLESDEPTLQSDEPTLQSDEPTLQSDEPTLQSDEPTLQSDEPTLQSDEPTLQSDEPTLQSDEPTLQSDEPTLQSDEPTLESDEPTLQSDEPTLQSDEPTLESDEPTLQSDEPTLESDEPTLQSDEVKLPPPDPTNQPDPVLPPVPVVEPPVVPIVVAPPAQVAANEVVPIAVAPPAQIPTSIANRLANTQSRNAISQNELNSWQTAANAGSTAAQSALDTYRNS